MEKIQHFNSILNEANYENKFFISIKREQPAKRLS